MGFISNPSEGNFLDSEEGQQDIAEDIANAIIGYKKEYFGAGSGDTMIVKAKSRTMTRVVDTPLVKTDSAAKKETKKDKEKVTPKEEPKTETKGIVFKIQISAGNKKLELKPSNFKGLNNISVVQDGNFYKYAYGETDDYDTAKKNLSEAKAKGYSSAYIIAFKDGEKISVKEATKN
jgi:N-acetylmuramoyl-L-alanine amidase